jgi:hypothetical protein
MTSAEEDAASGRRDAVTGRAGRSGEGFHGIRVYRRVPIFAVTARERDLGEDEASQEVIRDRPRQQPVHRPDRRERRPDRRSLRARRVQHRCVGDPPAPAVRLPRVRRRGRPVRDPRRDRRAGLDALVVFLPLASGIFSWLQARRRFCAGFAVARVSNFADGDEGRRRVEDEAAHRADIAAVRRMTRDSILIAIPIAILAALLPV